MCPHQPPTSYRRVFCGLGVTFLKVLPQNIPRDLTVNPKTKRFYRLVCEAILLCVACYLNALFVCYGVILRFG
ncbi:hypothetical protein E2C01_027699 [Portunus trituberculatus]|uniref:Uncharacterized protein n=1 Tax=Portunus trituberculatus TaxID=210409 RepID=A0A5B7EMV5_PORTR|nr:hypothetical protein [Portunus trituberculatus]